jgi:hypothetical protein
MTKQHLTPEEISAIVDGLDPIDWVQMELLAKLPPEKRYLVSLQKTEEVRADLRNKFIEDFPELSSSEVNMMVLRSLTSVRMGKTYTEPAYYDS